MQKIPTLSVRDWDNNPGRVTDVIDPACQWVIDGEGTPTRKYDGTCVMLQRNPSDPADPGTWWARREVKPDKTPPEGFRLVTEDPETGKRIGWEPIEQTGFRGAWTEALAGRPSQPGTYELCGPKINKNPEGFRFHRLMRHEDAERPGYDVSDLGPKALVTALAERGWEGIVWHHPDGRMAKLKARDLGVDVIVRNPALVEAAPEPVDADA
jgi:hypothetical protein